MSVYERIKQVANQNNLTISTIEAEAGISNGSIVKWKSTMPKADNLYNVSLFLGKSVEYFLTGIETSRENLTPDQQEILDLYNKLDPIKQAEFKGELKGFIKAVNN